MKTAVLKICPVISVSDDTDGERIKVRLSPEDDAKIDSEIKYAFPLLPKLIHVKPKVGEYVLVVLSDLGNGDNDRYYIGPIISQPQFMNNENSATSALSLYPGSPVSPDVAPSTNIDSHGSLAKDDDIAIYGRKKSDIILTEDDVRVRCGCRLKDSAQKGGLLFNRSNPAFLHLKHTDNTRGIRMAPTKTNPNPLNDEYKSTATIVADKINLISNNSNYPFKTNDKENLISDDEMQKIVETAYKLPYGDLLVEFLKLFVEAFKNHFHEFPGLIPYEINAIKKLYEYKDQKLDKILSDNIRIN